MSTFNRTTLVEVLEILDSSHAGEALAAAKLASTMVREAGLTWDDVPRPRDPGPRHAGGGRDPRHERRSVSATGAIASSRRTSSFSWCC